MKRIAILVGFFLMLFCLQGCGSGSSLPKGSPASSAALGTVSEDSAEVQVEIEPVETPKPVRSLNLAVFPFGTEIDNVRYIVEALQLPFEEKSFEKIDAADLILLDYDMSLEDYKIQVFYKDVPFEVGFIERCSLCFNFDIKKEKLYDVSISGVIPALNTEKDIKAFISDVFKGAGLAVPEIKHFAAVEKYNTKERYFAKAKIDGTAFSIDVSEGSWVTLNFS